MQNATIALPSKAIRASSVIPDNRRRFAAAGGLNYGRWLEHFALNRLSRPEPAWSIPVAVSREAWIPLLRSLEQFRLGDGGGPASLIAFDAERFRGTSDEIRRIVDAWFNEEKEHARLLGCAVQRMGGRHIDSHWSFTAFCATRRWLGVEFELQVLLLTEIVSTGYYRVMRRHVGDQVLRDMCGLILRDEAGHVEFHLDRLVAAGRPGRGAFAKLWKLQFWVLGHAAAAMLWVNHAPGLRALGGTRGEYFREVRREIGRFVGRLERRATDGGL